MIVEKRTYDIAPGDLAALIDLYQKDGLDIQVHHLGALLGYFTSESGILNQVVQLWVFSDHGDREARRTALYGDPAWLAYLAKAVPLVKRQHSVFLRSIARVRPVSAEILGERLPRAN